MNKESLAFVLVVLVVAALSVLAGLWLAAGRGHTEPGSLGRPVQLLRIVPFVLEGYGEAYYIMIDSNGRLFGIYAQDGKLLRKGDIVWESTFEGSPK